MVLTVLSGVGIGMVMPPMQVMVQLAAGREVTGQRDGDDLDLPRASAARSAWH